MIAMSATTSPSPIGGAGRPCRDRRRRDHRRPVGGAAILPRRAGRDGRRPDRRQRDVIPYAMAFGDHAELAGLNLIGLKRRGRAARRHPRPARAPFASIFLRRRPIARTRARGRRNAWPRSAGSGGDRRFHSGDRQAAASAPRGVARRCGRRHDDRACTLGIIAGGGELPRAIARKRARAGRDVFVLALRGSAADDGVEDFPHEWVSLGEPGKAFKLLKQARRDECCWRAGWTRPEIRPSSSSTPKACWCCPVVAAAPRATTRCCAPGRHLRGRGLSRRQRGGSRARSAVRRRRAGPASSRRRPDKPISRRAFAIVRALGALDVGQAAVGLRRAGAGGGSRRRHRRDDRARRRLARKSARHAGETARRAGEGARSRPRTRKTDMPVIGVETVRTCRCRRPCRHCAGSGRRADRGQARRCAEAADRLGLFVIGVERRDMRRALPRTPADHDAGLRRAVRRSARRATDGGAEHAGGDSVTHRRRRRPGDGGARACKACFRSTPRR